MPPARLAPAALLGPAAPARAETPPGDSPPSDGPPGDGSLLPEGLYACRDGGLAPGSIGIIGLTHAGADRRGDLEERHGHRTFGPLTA